MLRLSKADSRRNFKCGICHNALNVFLVFRKEILDIVYHFISAEIDDGQRTEKFFIFFEHYEIIIPKLLLVQQVNGSVVVVIIGVLVVIDDFFKVDKILKQSVQRHFRRNEQSGNISAAQPEISENILRKSLDFFIGFITF